MKYSIVEEKRLIRPLYKSFFPISLKNRENGKIALSLVNQSLFRKSIRLYVDDMTTYHRLGGHTGQRQVETIENKDSLSMWNHISGIATYNLPHFVNIHETVKYLKCPEYQIVTDVVEDSEIVTIHAETLNNVDSIDGLDCVSTIFFDYVKNCSFAISLEIAKSEEEKSKNYFFSKLKTPSLRSYKEAEGLIRKLLKPQMDDSGIVRKSKCHDFCKVVGYIESHFGMSSFSFPRAGDYASKRSAIRRVEDFLYNSDIQ